MVAQVPRTTIDWLLAEDNPAVAVLTGLTLLNEADSAEATELWSKRNDYAAVATILDVVNDDGSWASPSHDYKKYEGNLWQIHFLGELWADPSDPRVQRAAQYAFSRQLPDGSWSCNGRPVAAIPCLTANVARALARLGYAQDERIVRALAWVADPDRPGGPLSCIPAGAANNLNGYCHMLAPKLLLLLAEVPRKLWPEGAEEARNAAVAALRDKEVFHCLPKGSRQFFELIWSVPEKDRPAARERFLEEAGPLEYGPKPGWLRFGFPLSYNSDALEALASLAAVGESMHDEYAPALELVRSVADSEQRWTLRNTLNGKMLADVEVKGQPSKWLTLRALGVLKHFEA